jgi:hypothetical protein
MSEYRTKWNKFLKVFAPKDVVSIIQSPNLLSKITNYQPSPEEREIILDKNPEPDFDAIVKDDDTKK